MTDEEIQDIVESNFEAAENDARLPEYSDPSFPEWTSFKAYQDNAIDTVKERGGSLENMELALSEFLRLVNRTPYEFPEVHAAAQQLIAFGRLG